MANQIENQTLLETLRILKDTVRVRYKVDVVSQHALREEIKASVFQDLVRV